MPESWRWRHAAREAPADFISTSIRSLRCGEMALDLDRPGCAEHVDEHDLALLCAHAGVDRCETGELAGDDLDVFALLENAPRPWRWWRRQADARPRPQRLSAHQTFDLVQAARKACFQDVAPDPTRAIGAGARHEARPYRRHDRFILPRARARAAFPARHGSQTSIRQVLRKAMPPARRNGASQRSRTSCRLPREVGRGLLRCRAPP